MPGDKTAPPPLVLACQAPNLEPSVETQSMAKTPEVNSQQRDVPLHLVDFANALKKHRGKMIVANHIEQLWSHLDDLFTTHIDCDRFPISHAEVPRMGNLYTGDTLPRVTVCVQRETHQKSLTQYIIVHHPICI